MRYPVIVREAPEVHVKHAPIHSNCFRMGLSSTPVIFLDRVLDAKSGSAV